MPKTVLADDGYWMVDTDFGQPRYAIGDAADHLLNAGFHFIEDPRTGDDDTAVPPFVQIPDPRVVAAPAGAANVVEEEAVSEPEQEPASEASAEPAAEAAANADESEAAAEAPKSESAETPAEASSESSEPSAEEAAEEPAQ